jgi:periplasmic protein TonB
VQIIGNSNAAQVQTTAVARAKPGMGSMGSPAVPSRVTAEIAAPPDVKVAYLNNPPPLYPRMARRARMEGRCLLEVTVDINGIARSVRLLKSSGYDLLDQAALTAIQSWRFTPARHRGQAVAARAEVPIRFSLSDGG